MDNVICFQEQRIEHVVRREVDGMGAPWVGGRAIKSALNHFRIQKQSQPDAPDIWRAIRHGLNVAKQLRLHGIPVPR